MDTLTKLQTIRDFEKWAAAHKIDASPLALLEYLDQAGQLKEPAAERVQPAAVAKNCRTCKWQYVPVEQSNCMACRAYSLWERAK